MFVICTKCNQRYEVFVKLKKPYICIACQRKGETA